EVAIALGIPHIGTFAAHQANGVARVVADDVLLEQGERFLRVHGSSFRARARARARARLIRARARARAQVMTRAQSPSPRRGRCRSPEAASASAAHQSRASS